MSMAYALAKWDDVKDGKKVVFSDETLDFLSDHFKNSDSLDADLFFRDFVTTMNPKQVGTWDQYIGHITVESGWEFVK